MQNLIKFVILVISPILLVACRSSLIKSVEDRLVVSIPTIHQEASSIWRTINDIEFFERQGYNIALPQDELINNLIEKSKNKAFGSDDFQAIYALLENGVYQEEDYQAALNKVLAEKNLINGIIQKVKRSLKNWDWNFKLYDNYNVVFTLYGSGGSYNPDTGEITLFTTKEGGFKNYTNPANTIVHEFAHLGMEHSIVEKYKLSHTTKERVVDLFVYHMFGDLLPNYQIQTMGNNDLDNYIDSAGDFAQLDSIFQQITDE